jgi:hypothetical protein
LRQILPRRNGIEFGCLHHLIVSKVLQLGFRRREAVEAEIAALE